MGRKRPLANINAQDYKLRTQAERQAVNFVVQGKKMPAHLPTYLPISLSALAFTGQQLWSSQKSEYSTTCVLE